MSDTVFTKVDYDLANLVSYIELGEIGLPDIQRPFVWKNSKVRDLFDSMYKGYPVGYFLFWQNGLAEDRSIGSEPKQKTARLVIVDGQQRLTSLYSVLRGIPVVRESYKTERIKLAFNPIDETFEVADAAIIRDPAYISDVSTVWASDTNVMTVARQYLKQLSESRALTDQLTETIEGAIIKLHSLTSFPFTALELSANVSEEDVSDVFVRINSAGTLLNQADFILTLMSVFWDDGRTELESFCRAAREPTTGSSSPFNHFIYPEPSQLLRVNVALAFRRARLQYVYSILRGKDLETGEFSKERQEQQFEELKKAQERTLNIQYWHDFLACIRAAGFRSQSMISSPNNLMVSYTLYLLGRTEYNVEEFKLRQAISQWFFMSAITGRFTGSPESALEADLARLPKSKNPDEFVNTLQSICEMMLTNDFWEVTLPNDLATSSPRSPSLFAYNAALVLLDSNALFSRTKVADLLDPTTRGNRLPIERHHLFPRGYLGTLGISDTKQTNQIANYSYVEWSDNSTIGDRPPHEYVPEMAERFGVQELQDMYELHALPEDWEKLGYSQFLEKRRELMGTVTRRGYEALVRTAGQQHLIEDINLSYIMEGETESVEFKSTLRKNLHTGEIDHRIEHAALKTICAFLNKDGGTLFIGVTDDGSPIGIDQDSFDGDEDKMSLHLVNLVNQRIGKETTPLLKIHFEDFEDERIMTIKSPASSRPIFLKSNSKDGLPMEEFWIRSGTSSHQLSPSQTQSYLEQRF